MQTCTSAYTFAQICANAAAHSGHTALCNFTWLQGTHLGLKPLHLTTIVPARKRPCVQAKFMWPSFKVRAAVIIPACQCVSRCSRRAHQHHQRMRQAHVHIITCPPPSPHVCTHALLHACICTYARAHRVSMSAACRTKGNKCSCALCLTTSYVWLHVCNCRQQIWSRNCRRRRCSGQRRRRR